MEKCQVLTQLLALCDKIPSLTVSKRKNRCIPCIYWVAAIFAVVTKYSNLFPSFTFFLDSSHFTFGYVLIIGSKATDSMKIMCDGFPYLRAGLCFPAGHLCRRIALFIKRPGNTQL